MGNEIMSAHIITIEQYNMSVVKSCSVIRCIICITVEMNCATATGCAMFLSLDDALHPGVVRAELSLIARR
jgi:hypothetical protein